MSNIAFEVETRDALGKNKVKSLKEGFVPAIIYGGDVDPVPVSVERKEILKVFNKNPKGVNSLLDLTVKNGDKSEKTSVISYKIDYHPVKRCITHIDFFRVSDESLLKISVPCYLKGIAKGQKMAGIVIHTLKVVRLECAPSEIPESFDVDITNVEIGQNIRVSEIPLTGSMKLLNDPNDIVMQIDAPRVDKAALNAQAESEAAGSD